MWVIYQPFFWVVTVIALGATYLVYRLERSLKAEFAHCRTVMPPVSEHVAYVASCKQYALLLHRRQVLGMFTTIATIVSLFLAMLATDGTTAIGIICIYWAGALIVLRIWLGMHYMALRSTDKRCRRWLAAYSYRESVHPSAWDAAVAADVKAAGSSASPLLKLTIESSNETRGTYKGDDQIYLGEPDSLLKRRLYNAKTGSPPAVGTPALIVERDVSRVFKVFVAIIETVETCAPETLSVSERWLFTATTSSTHPAWRVTAGGLTFVGAAIAMGAREVEGEANVNVVWLADQAHADILLASLHGVSLLDRQIAYEQICPGKEFVYR